MQESYRDVPHQSCAILWLKNIRTRSWFDSSAVHPSRVTNAAYIVFQKESPLESDDASA